MAAKKGKRLFYNCIWTLLLAVMLALPTLGVMELSTLALEQETRCGQQEHNHTPECYFRDMLMCEKKAHNHSENCYLVLLEDNDINWLLSTIEHTEGKSLENVIDSAMVQALNLNPNLTSVNSQQIHLGAENVRQLNEVISENHIEPAVVLNENIRDNYLAYTPPQEEPEAEEPKPPETTAPPVETLMASTWESTTATTVPMQTIPGMTEPPELTEPSETTGETEPPATTEETEPPATTEETEPPATTEETEPPATTEETEPPVTTEETEPPATTEETEPPATTEETEPSATTEETEPPATTEETEPPVTTEETEPPATTEETEPPATTEETEPPATTEETEPPATTEETEPPATTEETAPPATTEETEPPVTTEETEPPATTEETEPPATTEETEPPATTEETVPAEPGFLWEPGKEILILPEKPAEAGEVALYLYHNDYWVCTDVLPMDQEQLEEEIRYSITPETVQEAYGSKILADTDAEEILHYAPQSPAEGIADISAIGEDSISFGEGPGHFYLTVPTEGPESQILYEPIVFYQVILDDTAADGSLGTAEYYVQSGQNLAEVCSETYLWQDASGETASVSEPVTEDLKLYARLKPEEPLEEIPEETEPLETKEQGENQLYLTAPLQQVPEAGEQLLMAAPSPGTFAAGDTGIEPRAVGGTPNTGTRRINFYIMLDGEITFVNSATLTRNNSNWEQSKRENCTYDTVVTAYTSNTGITTGMTKENLGKDYYFLYGSYDGGMNSPAIFVANSKKVYFANSDSAQYAILSSKSGNFYPPVEFYTVTLDRSGIQGTTEKKYVESGMSLTLSATQDTMWYLDAAGTQPVTENAVTIDGTTTFYALPRSKTVTFESNGGSSVDAQKVGYGSKVEKPTDPALENHVFAGWYTDRDLKNLYDFDTAVTDHMTLYAKWLEACTVSFVDPEGKTLQQPQTVGKGTQIVLPSFYTWTAPDGQVYQGGDTVTITGDTTFTGELYTYTVTFRTEEGIYETLEKVPHGSTILLPRDPGREGYDFQGWYTDENYSQQFDVKQPVEGNLQLYAKWGFHVTLNYLDLQDKPVKTETISCESGDVITLPEDYVWTNPVDGTEYPGGIGIPVTSVMTFIGRPKPCTVSFVNAQGSPLQEPFVLVKGSSFIFPNPPEGHVWEGSDGNHYVGGDYFASVESDLTFTARETSLKISYTVNFPTGSNHNVDKVPTLYGGNASTASDTIPGGSSATLRSLTSNTARKQVNNDNKESVTYYFRGWKVSGTDIIIPADTVLNWSQLAQYADASGTVNLVGDWVHGAARSSVTFFIRLDSRAVDINGNIGNQSSTDYTPELFNTYLGGVPDDETNISKYNIADTTADNSFTADQNIRALYGERANGIWMYEFPKDEDVFEYLKDYQQENTTKRLTVDGEVVDPNELDAKHYAIRWYVFKTQNQSWHVDGKLVKREGQIKIYKRFQGEEAAIDLAESGFYVKAENGTKNAAGEFTPFTSNDTNFKQYLLALDDTTVSTLKRQYPNATVQKIKQGNIDAHSYYWQIDGVLLDEYWQITEYPKNDLDGYSHYAEYSAYDSDGHQTAVAEYGTQAKVVGKTFALDEDPSQGMTVEFTNYYFKDDSILLKKEDAATGAGIPGAGFNFIQKENKLSFNGSNGTYVQDSTAGDSVIYSGSNGYASISGFSYKYGAENNANDRGSIRIQEEKVPEGYGWAATVELGLTDDENENVFIASVKTMDGQSVPQSEWHKYVELPRNDVLIIKNHVTDLTSVTAKKIWSTNVPADSVEVVLQANGKHVTDTFTNLQNAQVKLSAANNWTHTWEDLPRYAGGQLVTWGIKEVKVGGAATLSDGVTFANWIPVYSGGVERDLDSDGEMDNWYYTVTNFSKTPKLILTKVGAEDQGLPGAIFTLERVELKNGAWQTVGSPMSQTTEANGMLTFENLVGTYTYRLTEVRPPAQHIILIDPLIFTVDGDGNIRKLDDTGQEVPITGEFLKHDSAYHLTVKNLIAVEMPETGGCGTYVYWLLGLALMLAALLLYKLPLRKEDC